MAPAAHKAAPATARDFKELPFRAMGEQSGPMTLWQRGPKSMLAKALETQGLSYVSTGSTIRPLGSSCCDSVHPAARKRAPAWALCQAAA